MTLEWELPHSFGAPHRCDPPPAALHAEGFECSFSGVCQGQRLPIPAWEGTSPPSRRGRDRNFRLSGNGAFKDYTVQLQRGKIRRSCSLHPSSPPCLIPLFQPSNTCPGVRRCPQGHASPPSATPEPSFPLPGGMPAAG